MSSANLTRLGSRRKRRITPRRRTRQATLARRSDPRLAWYLGLGIMAAIEVIEWPLAIVLAIGHEITYRARTRALQELAKGMEAGA